MKTRNPLRQRQIDMRERKKTARPAGDCDLCPKAAIKEWRDESRSDGKPLVRYGGLCPEHYTPENEAKIVQRWKERT